jgi:hypothetical protein
VWQKLPDLTDAPTIESQILKVMRRVVVAVDLDTVKRIMCGGLCAAFILLAQGIRVPVRKRELFDLGLPMNTHTLPEVYHDGAWHLYDPTWGVVIRDGDQVLSLDELHDNPTRGRLYKVSRQIWQGKLPTEPLRIYPVPPQWLADVYGTGLKIIYRNMLKTARII